MRSEEETRQKGLNKRQRECLEGSPTKAEVSPRVILPDLNRLIIMPTSVRILTQEVLHKLPFVQKWSHATVWAEVQYLRSLTARATAGLGLGTVAHVKTRIHLHNPTPTATKTILRKMWVPPFCIVMP